MTGRDRIVVMVIAALAAVAGYWLLALGPKRHEAARLSDKVAEQRQQLQAAQSEVAASEAARTTYAGNYASVARLGKAVPTDDDVPALVYQLEHTASAAGVDFRSVKLMANQQATTPPPISGGEAPASSSGSSSANNGSKSDSTPSTGAGAATTATAAAATQASTATLPPGAAVGSAGFATMPFTFRFEGSFFHLANFFRRLERFVVAQRNTLTVSGRLLMVNGISLGASSHGFPRMTASVSVTAYLLPADEGLFAGATATSPSSGAAAATSAPTAPVTAPATATPPLR